MKTRLSPRPACPPVYASSRWTTSSWRRSSSSSSPGQERRTRRWRHHGKTQTQSNGCDGRISIVHFQKLSPATPPNSPAPLKEGTRPRLYGGFVKRAVMTPVQHDVTEGGGKCVWWGEEDGGGKQLKKKARMIQSLRIRDFRRKMDIGVET